MGALPMARPLSAGLLVIALLVAGCGLFAPIFGPVSQTTTSNVDQAKDEGYLRFANITASQEIVLDGQLVGPGAAYTGGDLLGVSPGTHEVEIREAGLTRWKQK